MGFSSSRVIYGSGAVSNPVYPAAPTTYSTAGTYTYVVGSGVNTLRFEGVGAGGGADNFAQSTGGGGSGLSCKIPVTPLESLTIIVGGKGYDGNSTEGINIGKGGSNGGGNAGNGYGGGGGGGTVIKRGSTALAYCGAGGGAGETQVGGAPNGAAGGAGNGQTGVSSNSGATGGGGGTSSGGGTAGSGTTYNGAAGSSQQGANVTNSNSYGGGGGGGYYGGGSGGDSYSGGEGGAGGGSGSSFANVAFANTITYYAGSGHTAANPGHNPGNGAGGTSGGPGQDGYTYIY